MSIEASAGGTSDSRRTPASERTKLYPIYKAGQGYWTRLGTALGAAGVILFVASKVYGELAVFSTFKSPSLRFLVAALTVIVLVAIAQWVMNGPKRAQFLIDTDSELKKVNWGGSVAELIGSTRVVIFFMVLTAVALFVFDTQFHALFYALHVWHIPFDKAGGVISGLLLSGTLLAIGVGLLRQRGESEAKRSGTIVTCLGAAVLVAWLYFAFFGSFRA